MFCTLWALSTRARSPVQFWASLAQANHIIAVVPGIPPSACLVCAGAPVAGPNRYSPPPLHHEDIDRVAERLVWKEQQKARKKGPRHQTILHAFTSSPSLLSCSGAMAALKFLLQV